MGISELCTFCTAVCIIIGNKISVLYLSFQAKMLKKKNDHSFLFVTKCFQFCNVNGHAQRHISHLAVSTSTLIPMFLYTWSFISGCVPSPVTSPAPHHSYIIPLTKQNQPPEHNDNKTHILPLTIHPHWPSCFQNQTSVIDNRGRPGVQWPFLVAVTCPRSLKFSIIATLILFTPLSLNEDKSMDLHTLPKGFSVL